MIRPVSILLHAQAIGFGGGERQLACLALGLDPARWKVHVLRQHPGGGWEPRLLEAGILLYHLQLTSYVGVQAMREAIRLRRYLAQEGIRITQGFDYTANVFVTPVARSVKGVIALSTQRCEASLLPNKYRRATRWTHRISSGVLVNSQTLARELTAGAALGVHKVNVCENGIDTEMFSPAPARESGGLTIGSICVFREEKRLDLLLEAFAAIAQQHPLAKLVLVGDGPVKPLLQAQALELGLGQRCEFQPATRDVAKCLKGMDIFVLPSRSEGLSNSLMEAMSCGLAVVASDVPANLELIDDNQNGLIFKSGDSTDLACVLERCLRQGQDRMRWGTKARERISEHYSIRASIERMELIYEKLLGKRER